MMGRLAFPSDIHTMDQPIVLRNKRKDLLALYAKRRTLDPFRSPYTLVHRRIFLKVLLAAIALVACSLMRESASWLSVLAAIFLLGALGLLINAFARVFRMRSSVHRWAKESEDGGEGSLQIQQDGFILRHKGSEFITRWEAVKRVELHEDYAVIVAHDERMYTKASMTPEQFEYLCDVLRDKVLRSGEPTAGPVVEA